MEVRCGINLCIRRVLHARVVEHADGYHYVSIRVITTSRPMCKREGMGRIVRVVDLQVRREGDRMGET
jgi:hypothetical protein